MNISDILALIKAGYTKADIDVMESINLVDQRDRVEDNTEDKTEDKTEKNLVEQKQEIPTETIAIPSIPKVEVKDSVEEKLDTLINLIQKQAILNSNIPDIPNLTLEDVAASIIDPNSVRRNELNGK